MGALPKKKISKARRGKRNANKLYSLPNLNTCSNCGKPSLKHMVCPSCGYYRGKGLIEKKESTKVTKVSKDER